MYNIPYQNGQIENMYILNTEKCTYKVAYDIRTTFKIWSDIDRLSILRFD